MTKANLVAIQAKMTLADYRDGAAFHSKIAALISTAAHQSDFSLPTLVSFPELIAMYLGFVPRYWDAFKDQTSLEEAATKLVMTSVDRVPQPYRTRPEDAARWLLYIEPALDAERAYIDAFATLARDYGIYISGGSIALPPTESEPSKGGRHVADSTKVYNLSYLFSPRGVILSRTPKVNMTSGLEARLFDAAPASEVFPVDTALGRVATLVCFDGFHETLVERCDALGTQILLKPSYNQHPWNGPSTYDPSHGEGESWLKTGCPSIIQGRENIRYGVNAMLVGAVFEDMAAEGRSSIARNTGNPNACWEDAILAIASKPDTEEIIAATVELP